MNRHLGVLQQARTRHGGNSIWPGLALELLWCTAPLLGQDVTALVDVNVVPMDQERILPDQTIIVRGTEIVAIGPAAEMTIEDGATVIDGAGSYVLPGLADMHVHFFGDELELPLLLAHGVTTARVLSGRPEYLRWREEIERHERVGPTLYVSSPTIDAPRGRRATAFLVTGTLVLTVALALAVLWGLRVTGSAGPGRVAFLVAISAGVSYVAMRAVVPFPDWLIPTGNVAELHVGSVLEADRAVRRAAAEYDQIKLYEHLTPRQFGSAVDAARASGRHTVGHVPLEGGLAVALEAGLQELAHAYFAVEEVRQRADTAGLTTAQAAQHYRSLLVDVVSDLVRAGVSVTSTLMPMPELLEQLTDSTAYLARQTFRFLPPSSIDRIRVRMTEGSTPQLAADLRFQIDWGDSAVVEMVRAGVPVVLGTDATPALTVGGAAVHEELLRFVGIGLTPFQALRAATINASRVVPGAPRWGSVAIGARADLLLVSTNPLHDIRTVRRPLGVMASGRWFGRAELDAMLTRVAALRSPG